MRQELRHCPPHRISCTMKARHALASIPLLVSLGCSTSPRSQERVRENTANATAAIASSAKSARPRHP